MTCPYKNPTISQCENCPLPDCTRTETADVNGRIYKWKKANPEKVRAAKRRYYANHREREIERNKAWYRENKENVLEAQRKRREAKKTLPCSECEHCKEILDTKNVKKYLCIRSMRMIYQYCKTSPIWCELRKKAERVS